MKIILTFNREIRLSLISAMAGIRNKGSINSLGRKKPPSFKRFTKKKIVVICMDLVMPLTTTRVIVSMCLYLYIYTHTYTHTHN